MKAVRAKIDNWTTEVVLLVSEDVACALITGDRVMVPWLLTSVAVYPREIAFVKAEIL